MYVNNIPSCQLSGINKYIVAEETYLRELQNQQDLKKDNLDYSTNNF